MPLPDPEPLEVVVSWIRESLVELSKISSCAEGEDVPIPTLPPESTTMRVSPLVPKFRSPFSAFVMEATDPLSEKRSPSDEVTPVEVVWMFSCETLVLYVFRMLTKPFTLSTPSASS